MKKKVVILVKKLWEVYGDTVFSSPMCEIYKVVSRRESVCYGCGEKIANGVEVNKIVVPTKANGGVTLCSKCAKELTTAISFRHTLCANNAEISNNTGSNTVIVTVNNVADIAYLKLYGFNLFANKFYHRITRGNGYTVNGKYILVKCANNALETMRNIKGFYRKDCDIYVNGVKVTSYEEAREACKMNIREDLKENIKK